MNNYNNIIDGRKLALAHEQKVKQKIAKLDVKLKVVSILIGDDPPSVLYTNMKQKKAQEVGIDFIPIKFPANSSFEAVADTIKKLNFDPSIAGIMVQLPLPNKFLPKEQTDKLLNLINPKKDIDGLVDNSPFLPATVRGIFELLEDENIDLKGKKVVVLGRSKIVGKPTAEEAKKRGAYVDICHSKTENLKKHTLAADILIAAVGKPHLVTGDMVKVGVVVIDVGTQEVNGKLVGDVDFKNLAKKASKITPVPGGVGPMTVIALMENAADSVLL